MIFNTPSSKKAVLLLAYGGPDSLDDIPAYLSEIRGGRHTPEELVEEITERYRLIGGCSPLLSITQSVAKKLQQRIGLPVYVGMRHWHPTIKDVVFQMNMEGCEHIIALCMAPHYSLLSIAKYRESLDAAMEAANLSMAVNFIESWHDQPEYIKGIAFQVRETLDCWPKEEQEDVLILFTAHSLPEFILDQGDPYDRQLRQTASLIANELALPNRRWMFSYQSAARTNVPWLGPQIEDLVEELADKGCQNLLIAPIGFIADHVEILYDIDIGVQEIARRKAVQLRRTPMLNDRDQLIDALTSLVQAEMVPLNFNV